MMENLPAPVQTVTAEHDAEQTTQIDVSDDDCEADCEIVDDIPVGEKVVSPYHLGGEDENRTTNTSACSARQACIPNAHLLFTDVYHAKTPEVETFARDALHEQGLVARKTQLLELWRLLPSAAKLRFRSSRHVMCQFGMSSRSSAVPTKAATLYPFATLLLTRIVRETFPNHLLTTVCLKENCKSVSTGVHKDLTNAPLPTAILGIAGTEDCGIWIEDSQGNCQMEHEGKHLRGTIRSIDLGITFSARHLWHCNVVSKDEERGMRLVLIAYVGRNVASCQPKLSLWLSEFCFSRPNQAQLEAAMHDVYIEGKSYRQSRLLVRRSSLSTGASFLQVDTSRTGAEHEHHHRAQQRKAPRLDSSARLPPRS